MAKVSLPPHLVTVTIFALVDGLEIYFPILTEQQKRMLRWRRLCEVKRCRVFGWRAIVTRPSAQAIKRLDRLTRKYRGTITRVDVALEISGPDHLAVHSWIVTHAIMRWRKGPMGEEGGTVYWQRLRRGKKCRRNLVVYSDRINRVTGETTCTHVELRLMCAPLIRRNGIYHLTDLLKLNPQELFDRHVGWSNAGDDYVKKIVREHVDADRRQYAGKRVGKWEDRYRAGLSGRVRRVLSVLQLDRAQVLKNAYPQRKTKLRAAGLDIPGILEW